MSFTSTAEKKSQQANLILIAILEAIIEHYKLVGSGAPLGHIYAAVMTAGVDYETFTSMIALLKRSRLIEVRGFEAFPSAKVLDAK